VPGGKLKTLTAVLRTALTQKRERAIQVALFAVPLAVDASFVGSCLCCGPSVERVCLPGCDPRQLLAQLQLGNSDFSHGRFISVFQGASEPDPVLFCGVGPPTDFKSSFEATRTIVPLIPVIRFSSKRNGPLGALELLVWIQSFASEIALH
jgi:hypothetical protein